MALAQKPQVLQIALVCRRGQGGYLYQLVCDAAQRRHNHYRRIAGMLYDRLDLEYVFCGSDTAAAKFKYFHRLQIISRPKIRSIMITSNKKPGRKL